MHVFGDSHFHKDWTQKSRQIVQKICCHANLLFWEIIMMSKSVKMKLEKKTFLMVKWILTTEEYAKIASELFLPVGKSFIPWKKIYQKEAGSEKKNKLGKWLPNQVADKKTSQTKYYEFWKTRHRKQHKASEYIQEKQMKRERKEGR